MTVFVDLPPVGGAGGGDATAANQVIGNASLSSINAKLAQLNINADGSMSVSEGLLAGVSYNDIQTTYPTALIENYAYYLGAVLKATVEVTYSDVAKTILLRARRI